MADGAFSVDIGGDNGSAAVAVGVVEDDVIDVGDGGVCLSMTFSSAPVVSSPMSRGGVGDRGSGGMKADLTTSMCSSSESDSVLSREEDGCDTDAEM